MKFATSLKFSGELIAAANCDYDSFKQFMLICPHCKQSVYLIGEHGRAATVRKLKSGNTTSVKESSISAYFAHHLLDVESCEAKDSSISSQFILHRKTVARNQRLAIFRDRFWRVFCTAPSMSYLLHFTKDQKSFDQYFDRVMKTEVFESSVMKNEIFSFANNGDPQILGIQNHALDREHFSMSLAAGMQVARENYSMNLLHRSFSSALPETVDIVLKSALPDHLYRKLYLPFVLEPLCFLYAPPNKKILRKCLTALVLCVYTQSLDQAIKHVSSTAAISQRMTVDEARQSVHLLTHNVATSLLSGKEAFVLSNSATIEVSSLFVILLIALSAVDWGFEFEKHQI